MRSLRFRAVAATVLSITVVASTACSSNEELPRVLADEDSVIVLSPSTASEDSSFIAAINSCMGAAGQESGYKFEDRLFSNRNILGVVEVNAAVLGRGDIVTKAGADDLMDSSMSPEQEAALYGDGGTYVVQASSGEVRVPDAGCFGDAVRNTYGSTSTYAEWIGLQNDFLLFVNSALDEHGSTSLISLMRDYRNCMNFYGYRVNSPDEVQEIVAERAGGVNQSPDEASMDLELLLRRDIDCELRIDYSSRADAVALELGSGWIDAHRSRISELAAWRYDLLKSAGQ